MNSEGHLSAASVKGKQKSPGEYFRGLSTTHGKGGAKLSENEPIGDWNWGGALL